MLTVYRPPRGAIRTCMYSYMHVRIYTFTVNVGLAVGLSLGLFFLIVLSLVVPICFVCCFVCAAKRHRSTVRTHVVATTPSGETTVVTANQATATSAPVVQPPLQQQEYKHAQFSSQEAPPSYSAATAFPTYTGPHPLVMCWWLSVHIPSTYCLLGIFIINIVARCVGVSKAPPVP